MPAAYVLFFIRLHNRLGGGGGSAGRLLSQRSGHVVLRHICRSLVRRLRARRVCLIALYASACGYMLAYREKESRRAEPPPRMYVHIKRFPIYVSTSQVVTFAPRPRRRRRGSSDPEKRKELSLPPPTRALFPPQAAAGRGNFLSLL